jgi:hypothetical protein
MTQEEKINNMKIAAGICGFGFDHKGLDLLVSLYELISTKEGKTDISDITKVEYEVKSRDDAKTRSELLDKVSEKIS